MSEIWCVRLANREFQMTLDELDAAYQSGSIDEQTLVREEGSTQWSTLGVLLGIDSSQAPVQESVRPLAVDLDDVDEKSLQGNRKRNVVIALFACTLAFGGIALAVTKLNREAPNAAAAAAGAMASPTVIQEAEQKLAKPPLSEEQRAALAKQDAEREKKAREAREKRLRDAPQARPQHKSGPVFTNKGDKYDPLNGGL